MKTLGWFAVLPLVTLLAACGDAGQAGGTRVVASFYPFAFVAEQVGGRHVDVDNLTSPGVEPHDVELKPKQVGAIQDADLVIRQRGFQSAVDRALDEAGRPASVDLDVNDVVRLRGDDPHTWLDPRNMIAITRAVEDRLAEADPAHAKAFAAKASGLERRLTRLDRDLADGLRDCTTRTIVTSHDAFGYLADRYDLTQVPIAGLDPANEPSPRQLAEISALVRRDGITTIFTEELVSPAVAETVARETRARTATLDPIEGLGDSNADETYLTLMRRNLDALRAANGCS